MEKDKLRSIIVDAAVETDGRKKLPCAKAFIIASENGVTIGEIGDICDEEEIRISHCQLGCFE